MSLEATNHIRAMGQGGSQSQLLRDRNGGYQVVKFIGNAQGTKILANELVTGGLGKILGASVPDVTTIYVSETLTNEINSKIGTHFRPGIQVATSYIPNCIAVSGPEIISKTDNSSTWSSSILLDTLTQNTDQKVEHVLIYQAAEKGKALHWEVDHGHTLGANSGWQALNSKNMTLVAPIFREVVTGQDPFQSTFQRLSLVSSSAVRGILTECPPEWGVSQLEITSLESFIEEGVRKLPEIISSSKSSFANWR